MILITAIVMVTAPIGGIMIMDNTTIEKEHVEDTTPPTSTIYSPLFYILPPLYDIGGITGFTVTWEGNDNEGGVGIDYFDVQYRYTPNNCYGDLPITTMLPTWYDLITNTTKTSTLVNVRHDMLYEFRVRAVDKNGNEESWPAHPQTRTFVVTVPNVIYKALVIGHQVADGIEGRIRERIPDDTPPNSRVLPLPPIAIPEPILTVDHEPRILLFPNIDITDPSFAPDDNPFGYWTYGSIPVRWEGRDPKGTEELLFDVQYRRTYLETDVVKIPEARIDPRGLPATTDWIDWLNNVTYNEEEFNIEAPGLYEFRCRATDMSGNIEEYPLTADASTYVFPIASRRWT